MKVRRVLLYDGEKEWIEQTLEHNYIQPGLPLILPHGIICEVECVTEEE